MQLLERVRRTIRAHDLAGPDTRVVAAVSGGSDSVALAYLLADLAANGELRIAGIAHLNHQLRAAAADDETFCAETAARLETPFLSHAENVADRARAGRRSIEDAARAARYEFFEHARRHFDADAVALGHTRDDQAETFLLRLLRGAGSRGLAGMHPRNGRFIRPLLECRRGELRALLEARHLSFVHDETNEDVSIPRNRVRAELLPLLERRFNPSIVDVLADEADIAREEWRWIDQAAHVAAPRVLREEGANGWKLDVAALNALAPAVARMIVRGALAAAAGPLSVSFRHVEDALRLARHGGAAIDGPGLRMERAGDSVVLTNTPAPPPETNLFRYPLSIPGEVVLQEAGCVVSAETAPSAAVAGAVPASGETAVLQLERCQGPLVVRNRRPGDRFRPLGLRGRKKLQDYFVDRKVARQGRDRIPLVVDEADRIVWVAGHSIEDEFRVTDSAQAVLILRLRQV
jgi:tRNA(Ile)-lysidine synthase